ncbi:MAG: exonuclease domain-containing protein [Anaerolineae bacterium]|nr:exonuclease domain-containing protein [Anaerolineae bacterium]
MAKKLDRILVVDLEATCWAGEPPPGEVSEIIEIGLCVLDVATGRRLDNPSIVVRAEASTISPYCTKLTTLTQEEVEAGLSLGEACRILKEQYRGHERVWASYGDYDRTKLMQECHDRGVEYPFGPSHINVKTLIALARNLPREVPLDEALALMDLPLEGWHHRGSDDAWNIARLLAAILEGARR